LQQSFYPAENDYLRTIIPFDEILILENIHANLGHKFLTTILYLFLRGDVLKQ